MQGGFGAPEIIFTILIIVLMVLSSFQPDGTAPTMIDLQDVTVDSMTIEWDTPTVGCQKGYCHYEILYRTVREVRTRQRAGRKFEYGAWILEDTSPVKYEAIVPYLKHTVRIVSPGSYQFKIRHAMDTDHQGDLIWGGYSPESPVFESLRLGSAQEAKGKRKPLFSGFNISLRKLWSNMLRISRESLHWSLVLFFVSFIGRLIGIPRGIFDIIDLLFALSKVHVLVMVCVSLSAMSMFRQDGSVVLNFLVNSVAILASIIVMQLLWWQASHWDWPVVADPAGFSAIMGLLSMLEIYVCKVHWFIDDSKIIVAVWFACALGLLLLTKLINAQLINKSFDLNPLTR